jgi:tRNA threonylcarbamoyladenosine biosynthesis protein TsaB
MKILALEFSSPRRGVAVLDGSTVLAEQAEVIGQNIPPLRLVEQALAATKLERKQIECIAVGLGPGSYTGIRGAIALAQGWQLAAGVKLLGVSSADAVAAQAQAEKLFGRVNVVVDAQRGEFYLAGYDISAHVVAPVASLKIVSAADIRSAAATGPLAGPEVTRWFPDGREVFPTAAALGQLAASRQDFASGDQLMPIYLRETSFVKAPPVRDLPTL